MLVLNTGGVFVIFLLQQLALLCSCDQGPRNLNPECNNHGTILPGGRCRCYNNWYGRKCEHIQNVEPSRQGGFPGGNHRRGPDPECNNHGSLTPDGRCRCVGRWFGRKCELVRNVAPNKGGYLGDNHHRVPDQECNYHGSLSPDGYCRCGLKWYGRKCELGPRNLDPKCNNHGTILQDGRCRCYNNWYGRKCERNSSIKGFPGDNHHRAPDPECNNHGSLTPDGGRCRCVGKWYGRKCELVHHVHNKVTSQIQKTTASMKLAMTTDKPTLPQLTSKQSTISPSTSTSVVTKTSSTTATSMPTYPNAVITSSKSPATSINVSSSTIPSSASVTSVFVSTMSNSVLISASSSTSNATTASSHPYNISHTIKPVDISNSTRKVLPTQVPSVTSSVLSKVSTNPPPKTLPPVSTECAVCSGPAVLCEQLYASTTCHPPNNYCINTVANHKDGTKSVNRTCGNFDTCFREWFQGSSDSDKCRSFDETDEEHLDFQCTFCCVEDNCNIPLLPTYSTLYKPV